MPGMRFAELRLEAPADSLGALEHFYAQELGLPRLGAGASVAVGPSRLCWRAAEDDRRPFYHFAFLVPGHRFDAALAWLAERVALEPSCGEPVVAFPDWDAVAVYFHDPAGSIVELIAHRGIEGDGPARGAFAPSELLGISEVGIVVDEQRSAVGALCAQLGVCVWTGAADETLDETDALAFVGRKAHTLILAPPGRGWMPTGRPAEVHPAHIVLEGTPRVGSVALPGRVTVSAG